MRIETCKMAAVFSNISQFLKGAEFWKGREEARINYCNQS